jgi:hypothetical protein
MPTAAELSVGQGLLELSWIDKAGSQLADADITQINHVLDHVALIAGLGSAMAIGLEKPEEVTERIRMFPTKVRRLRFESPLFLSVEVPRAVVESALTVGFLMYALKRAWGFDLELRTHRSDLQRRFVEAQERVLLAERRYKQLQTDRPRRRRLIFGRNDAEIAEIAKEFEEMDQDLQWPKGTSQAAEHYDPDWEGDEAVLHLEEE